MDANKGNLTRLYIGSTNRENLDPFFSKTTLMCCQKYLENYFVGTSINIKCSLNNAAQLIFLKIYLTLSLSYFFAYNFLG